MPNMRLKQEKDYNLLGWVLFIICAFLFIVSSFKNGDIVMLAGSIIFLAACVIFIIPLIKGRGSERKSER